MTSSVEQRALIKSLLDGLADLDVREMCIAALRRAHAENPTHRQLQLHGHLGRHLLPALIERKGAQIRDLQGLSEPFLDAITEDGMEGVAEFVSWFVRAGFAWPLGAPQNWYPVTLNLTRAGQRFLSLTEELHPLMPGSLDRLRERCPGLPDDVPSLVADARECLDHGLMRPAVVLLGVAYEVAIEHAIETLIARGDLPQAVQDQSAAKRIATVRAQIDKVLPDSTPQERDDRFATHRAYEFADDLRRRRNDASHTKPTYGFEDRAEVEELIISACRKLPDLWRMR
jgi:hypothetical protein